VIQHAEDTRMTGGCSMNAGALAFRLGLRGMTVEAESSLVERDLDLLKQVKRGHLHVAHLSTKKALDAVRTARRAGLRVTCEVTPHHFALTEERIGLYDTNAKMNPPLRAESDRAAMIEGILDGTVDAIATDHAPHAAYEKEQELDRAPNGITGRGTLALGAAGDVVVFDPAEKWVFHATESRSKSKNTPFDGWELQGRVRLTVSEGRVAFRRG
jgi:dihydroorotase